MWRLSARILLFTVFKFQNNCCLRNCMGDDLFSGRLAKLTILRQPVQYNRITNGYDKIIDAKFTIAVGKLQNHIEHFYHTHERNIVNKTSNVNKKYRNGKWPPPNDACFRWFQKRKIVLPAFDMLLLSLLRWNTLTDINSEMQNWNSLELQIGYFKFVGTMRRRIRRGNLAIIVNYFTTPLILRFILLYFGNEISLTSIHLKIWFELWSGNKPWSTRSHTFKCHLILALFSKNTSSIFQQQPVRFFWKTNVKNMVNIDTVAEIIHFNFDVNIK